jgi:hypothetical protein
MLKPRQGLSQRTLTACGGNTPITQMNNKCPDTLASIRASNLSYHQSIVVGHT